MIRLTDFYRQLFGCKVYKISLDADCTCPNRDGTKGTGGCIFCSGRGSGDFIADIPSIKEQFEKGKILVENKAAGRSGNSKHLYLPYFQAFTSTYGNPEDLKAKYLEALNQKEVCGISIATRPDCINEKITIILKELAQNKLSSTNKTPFIQIELGLQTSNEETGKSINRCYTNSDYINAVNLIKKELPQAHIVTHVIFGLPGETSEDMMSTVDFVSQTNKSDFGIKITNLYVLKNTVLASMLEKGQFVLLEMEEYFGLVKSALKILPQNCVIHRLNGDPPKREAVAPLWCLNKKVVLTQINQLLGCE